uniref:Protein inturned n=1 Tax=Oncorhynchus mykiss TaxID=8022 RepID=A0A8C7W5P3_ONCMY
VVYRRTHDFQPSSLPSPYGSCSDETRYDFQPSFTHSMLCRFTPSDLEPEWLDDVQKNGELFYLELSEGEEAAALAQVATNYGLSTNHVRFSEKEAEIISDESRKLPDGAPTKAEPKLKRLARILRRKRRPSQSRGPDGGGEDSSSRPVSILKNQAGQRVGVMVQQLKEVFLYLNPKRLGSCSPPPPERGGLLEALLGVVHRPSWGRGQGDPAGRREERITVHGLVPNSPAVKCAQILIGDNLVAVDDVDVTTENIERVLSCIPGPTQVRGPGEGGVDMSSAPRLRPSPSVSQLVRLLWGEDTVELQMSIGHIPHIVMYLSLKLDSDSPLEEQEILYQYPVSEASSQLKGVRGIFLTLSDMLENVTGGQIVSSSLLLNKQLVHVGYWKESNNLLVIALPAERYRHGKVIQCMLPYSIPCLSQSHIAFCQADHAPRLDHFFCLFFQQLIQPSRLSDSSGSTPTDLSGTLFLDGLPAVRWLPLPPEIKVWGWATTLGHEDFYGMRRLYVTLGSCLFYKGYLIANHLPKEDLLDVSLYCQHYCLLPLASEQRVGQLVVWREVFPRHRSQIHQTKTINNHCTMPGYCQPQGRYFLLIVGLRHFMQCVLLEASGCAAPATGAPGPDCVYVDQVKATLLQLEELDLGMEERLAAPPAPCLSCADWFLPSFVRDRLDTLAASSPVLSKLAGGVKPPSLDQGGGKVVGRSLFGRGARRPSSKRSQSDSGSEGQSDGGVRRPTGLSPHSTPDSARKLVGQRDSLGSGGSDGSRGSGSIFKSILFYSISHYSNCIPSHSIPPHSLLFCSMPSHSIPISLCSVLARLTSGAENTLFHYVLMEKVQGIFIAPTHRELAQLSGSIHPQLIRNFHHCCLSIRAAFQRTLHRGLFSGAGSIWRPQGTHGLGPVKEHGVLFQCKPENWTDQRKPAPTMTYWVIGRMLLEPVPQEFYVCFHDSVAEVPVEMAFRLSFGLAL